MSEFSQGAVPTTDNSLFKRLLPDTDVGTFFTGYWDKTPLHMPACEASPGGFSDLVSARDIEWKKPGHK